MPIFQESEGDEWMDDDYPGQGDPEKEPEAVLYREQMSREFALRLLELSIGPWWSKMSLIPYRPGTPYRPSRW